LSGAQARMAQQLLDGPDVGASVEEVCCTAVAERVRMQARRAHRTASRFDETMSRPRTEAPASAIDKEWT
jgi:hypothetical protein